MEIENSPHNLKEENKDDTENKKMESEITEYIKNLGLSWNALSGKKILEIGSGMGDFGLVAKKKNIDVVSVDRFPELYKYRGGINKGIKFVKAEAEKLPFTDNSFDYVVSSGAPPTLSESKEEYLAQSKELLRVLKVGGELRIFPALVRIGKWDSNDDGDERYLSDEKISEMSKNIVKEILPDAQVQKNGNQFESRPWFEEYFLIKKPLIFSKRFLFFEEMLEFICNIKTKTPKNKDDSSY